MNKKVFVSIFAIVFSVTSFNTVFAQTKKVAMKSLAGESNQLASNLPNSDAVFNINMSRLMKEGIPQILSAKPQYLDEFNAKIEEIKSKIGIDLRDFDQVAVGIAYKTISEKETDYEPVILARGKFNASSFVALAKVAANGKYREEKIGEKTVYIFTPKEILEKSKPKTKNSMIDKLIDGAMKTFSKEIAISGFDDNTLIMGSVARVRQAFEGKSKVTKEILTLASRNPTAILSMGANMPNGASQFINIDNDEIGKNIKSIKQMSGAFDINAGKATLAVTAKTLKNNDAQSLEEFLSGMQMVGKALLGGVKGDDKKLYARLIETAVISRKTNEVMLDLEVPKSDMDALMAILLK